MRKRNTTQESSSLSTFVIIFPAQHDIVFSPDAGTRHDSANAIRLSQCALVKSVDVIARYEYPIEKLLQRPVYAASQSLHGQSVTADKEVP